MTIKISKCGLSSKTWAMTTALSNLALGIAIIIGGSIWMAHHQVEETFMLYFIVGVGIGVMNIAAGCILITALVQGKENTVLLYILLEFVIVFVLTVFSAMNIYEEFSLVMFILLASCPLLWLGLYNVYGFYLELHNYNSGAVQAGVEEIACNTHTNPLVAFPEKALDTTTV